MIVYGRRTIRWTFSCRPNGSGAQRRGRDARLCYTLSLMLAVRCSVFSDVKFYGADLALLLGSDDATALWRELDQYVKARIERAT